MDIELASFVRAQNMSSEPFLLPQPMASDSGVCLQTPTRLQERVAGIKQAAFWLLGPFVLGFILAAIQYRDFGLSAVLGWTYFVAWTFSFWPQIIYNYRRKSVIGLSLDFQLLNLLGFLALSVYYVSLRYNASVREEYRNLHEGQLPAVHANDICFALHALVATIVTLTQCVIYERGGARPARLTVAAVMVTVIGVVAWAVVIVLLPASARAQSPASLLRWLTWLYFISFVKLGVSLVKYIPQATLNFRRQSTVGWNIWQVLLDFEGGVLSLTQLFLDAIACSDWSAVTGNPVKFGLGFVSMFFDIIFVVQHYCLYPDCRCRFAREAMERDFEDLEKQWQIGYSLQEGAQEPRDRDSAEDKIVGAATSSRQANGSASPTCSETVPLVQRLPE